MKHVIHNPLPCNLRGHRPKKPPQAPPRPKGTRKVAASEDVKALNWYRSVVRKSRPKYIPREILLTQPLLVKHHRKGLGVIDVVLATGAYMVERERPSRYLQILHQGWRLTLSTDVFYAIEVLSWKVNAGVKIGGRK